MDQTDRYKSEKKTRSKIFQFKAKKEWIMEDREMESDDSIIDGDVYGSDCRWMASIILDDVPRLMMKKRERVLLKR